MQNAVDTTKPKQNFIRLNTIFIPSTELQNFALDAAKEVTANKDHIFRIDNINFYSHMTIYSPEYPLTNTDKIISAVAQIALKQKVLHVTLTGFFTGEGYIGMGFHKSKEISNIHKTVIDNLNPLRNGRIRDKYEDGIRLGVYSEKEIGYINKYGYHNVFDNYEPHLTLARFKTETEAKIATTYLASKIRPGKKYPIHELGISKMGPNGTCTEIIKRFKLLSPAH